MRLINILISLFCIYVVLTSCTSPITISGEKKKLVEAKKIGLIETIISPHIKPAGPLIEAAFYRSSLDDIAPLIIIYNKEIIDSIQNCIKTNLTSKLNLTAYSYQELKNMDKLNFLKDSIISKRLAYNDDDFPRITILDSAINLFDFYKSHPKDYTNDNSPLYSYKTKINLDIVRICKEFNLDAAVVSVINVAPRNIDGFIVAYWHRCLNIELHFYGSDGIKFLTLEYDDIEGLAGAADNPVNYKECINDYKYTIPFMLDVLLDKQQNKLSKIKGYRPVKEKKKKKK